MLNSPCRFSSLRKILFTLSNKVIVWLFTLFRVQNYKKLSTPPKLRFKLYAFAPELYRRNWCFPTIWLTLPFDFSHVSLWFDSRFSSICLILFCNWTQAILWFYWTAEPSTLTRRAFAIATPKARQVDDEPSATSWIQRNASVSPKICFWLSPKELQ